MRRWRPGGRADHPARRVEGALAAAAGDTFAVRRLGPGDEAVVARAAALFDDPPDERATRTSLNDDRHHLLFAFDGEDAIGFVVAMELLLPDKPQPEMLLYEIGVAPSYRRRGVGRALMDALVALSHERGCGEMFVLTDEENEAAKALYAAAGGRREGDQVMFTWDWRGASPA